RALVDLPADIEELLHALDEAGAQRGGLWSAAGKLSSGTGSIRLAILDILFNSAGLPYEYPIAKFLIWLRQRGTYAALRERMVARGESFEQELKNLYVSTAITTELLEVEPGLAESAREV